MLLILINIQGKYHVGFRLELLDTKWQKILARHLQSTNVEGSVPSQVVVWGEVSGKTLSNAQRPVLNE